MILDYGRVLLKYEEEEEEWVGWQCSPTWEVTYPEKEKRKKEKGRRKSDLSSLKFKRLPAAAARSWVDCRLDGCDVCIRRGLNARGMIMRGTWLT